jgi:site-specific DNA-methyltransferase (adenine-specific)
MDTLKTNVLYYGDNLEILRKYIPDNSIDLVYLDPPFNSKRDYNILFKENGGVESEAQIKAFTDTWHWTQTAENTYHDIVTNGPLKVGQLIGALHDAIGQNDVMAYLVMMATRLIELHRVLKPTGSLYLHCDPTASHYLKLVLDQIFGPANFRNEIIWQRTSAGKPIYRNLPKNNDSIMWYTKTDNYNFQPMLQPLSEEDIATFNLDDNDGRGKYNTQPIINPGYRPNLRYVYKDLKGREWQPPKNGWRFNENRMHELEKDNRLFFTKNTIREKYYLSERITKGKQVSNVWTDIPFVARQEFLGYETQKPLALLERIIKASSNEGDIVLDPFCGCGTALVAAQKLNRRWIGIDITHLAITLMRNRLRDSFPGIQFEVIGEPVDLASAKALARQDRYQFQWWALGLIKARPLGEKKKGADEGIDGVIQFIDDPSGKPKRAVIQVKSGHVAVNAVRELKAVAAKDALGIFITLEPPTGPMQTEAVSAGFYHSPGWDKDYPKIQILTIEELLHGKAVDMPPQTQTSITFTKAQKITQKEGEQLAMK